MGDYMNYRHTRNYENLQKRIFDGVGQYGIPKISPVNFKGNTEFIGFHQAARCTNRVGKSIHFFIDDYRFIRIWSNPDRYIDMFTEFDYVMSPDFSTYTDFPKAVQIYNHYRKHWIGAYMEAYGIKVIPTISWSDKDSFKWCFDGEPEGGCVAVSSVGCMKSIESKRLFIEGYKEMISRLQPATIIFYGTIPDECRGNIVKIKCFSDKFKEAKINGW